VNTLPRLYPWIPTACPTSTRPPTTSQTTTSPFWSPTSPPLLSEERTMSPKTSPSTHSFKTLSRFGRLPSPSSTLACRRSQSLLYNRWEVLKRGSFPTPPPLPLLLPMVRRCAPPCFFRPWRPPRAKRGPAPAASFSTPSPRPGRLRLSGSSSSSSAQSRKAAPRTASNSSATPRFSSTPTLHKKPRASGSGSSSRRRLPTSTNGTALPRRLAPPRIA
jgi:hypothetical protein